MNDYIYGVEAEQFSFLRVPKVLLQHESYKHLSAEAKLLYSLFLDRVGISMKNGWMDNQKRICIIFTIDEIRDCLNCGRGKAIQLLNELEENAGLIERRRQGLTKPNLIYVKSLIRIIDENGNVNFLKFGSETTRSSKIEIQEVQETDSNNNELNKTEKKKTEISFLPERGMKGMEEGDRYADFFRKSLDYSSLVQSNPMDRDILAGILALLVEVCSCGSRTIKIAGDEKPLAVVKARLMELSADHIEYVLDCLKENSPRMRDTKQYLLTALFNAPVTIDAYYQAKVNYDNAHGSC